MKNLFLNNIVLNLLRCLFLFTIIMLINSALYSSTKVVGMFYGFTKKPLNFVFFFLIVIIFFYVLYRVILYIWTVEIKRKYFISILVFILILCFVVVLGTKIDLQHDPKNYFEYALAISKDSSILDLQNIYHRRILFYTLPILYLLPDSLVSVQCVNILFVIGAVSIYTFIISKEFGNKVALLFLVLFLFVPELYFATAIASHDLASIFYFSLLILLLHKIRHTKQKLWLYVFIILSAILIVVNDLQRSIKIPLLISLLLLIFIELKNLKQLFKFSYVRHLLVIIVFSITMFSIYKGITSRNGKTDDSGFEIETMIYSYNDMLSLGDYSAGEENRFNYLPNIPENYKKSISYEKFFTQFVSYPVKYASYLKNKTNNFFGNSFHHYFMDSRFLGKSLSVSYILFLIISFLLKIILYALAAYGLFLIFIKLKKGLFHKLYIIYPVIFLPIILLSEVNPTYSLLIIPSVLFFAAYGLDYLLKRKKALVFSNLKIIGKTALISMAILILLYLSSSFYINQTPIDLVDFKQVKYTHSNCEIASHEKDGFYNPFHLKVMPKLSNQDCSINLKLNKEYSTILFLIKTKAKPNEYSVQINGNSIDYTSYKFERSHIKNKEIDNNYYYCYNTKLEKSCKDIKLSFNDIVHDFLIKDVILH